MKLFVVGVPAVLEPVGVCRNDGKRPNDMVTPTHVVNQFTCEGSI